MTSNTQIFKISVSHKKGTQKDNVNEAELEVDFGIVGDAHAGSRRQVSMLPYESYLKFLESRDDISEIKPGDFADNITTIGFPFDEVEVGKKICIGSDIELEVTEIGKSECHTGCYIRRTVGDCIMPREGIFAKVLKGGKIKVGDKIAWGNRVL